MRVRIFFGTLVLLLLNGVLLYAQTDPGEPCGGNDVDNVGCPLDTWVVLLAFVALVFAAWNLNNKRKAAVAALQKL